MGKKTGYKKWWRLNDVPVVFVAPGVDPIMARRQYGDRAYWNKRKINGGLGIDAIIAIVSAIILVFGGGWWFLGRSNAEAAIATPTPAPTATIAPTATLSEIASHPRLPAVQRIRKPWFDPTPTLPATTPAITPTPTPAMESIANSPIQSPQISGVQSVAVVSPIATPTPTATPAHNYEVIANYREQSQLYSYVSGWIVEMDGKTPRPVGVELVYSTGRMMYPRPNNTDVANGHFEFMVSPGDYVLRVLDGDAPGVPVHVTDDPQRFEISFRHTRPGTKITPVVSFPWSGSEPDPVPAATPTATQIPSPTPTPPKSYHVYLPLILNNTSSTPPKSHHIYLPLVVK